MADLSSKHVLILAADGFEQSELFKPRQALLDAGVKVTLASIKTDPIQGVQNDTEDAQKITPDMVLGDVDTDDYDALLLPGGVANPDKMRMQERAVEIVQEFVDDGKIVAAICHAPWLLVEADVGRRREDDKLAVGPYRSCQCRSRCGRSGSGGRRAVHHQPQARRYPGVQRCGAEGAAGTDGGRLIQTIKE